MIPNNNLSVLPWYKSIEQQNARKWWIYNRVYPLFTPAGFLLPFQVMRDAIGEQQITPVGGALVDVEYHDDAAIAVYDDMTLEIVSTDDGTVTKYDLGANVHYLYFLNLPAAIEIPNSYRTNVAFVDDNDQVIEYYNLVSGSAGVSYTGAIEVPANATGVYVQYYAGGYPGNVIVYKAISQYVLQPITNFTIYTADGTLVGDFSNEIVPQISLKNKGAIDVIIYAGILPFTILANGQYYGVMTDGTNTWYSEIFTVVNDISPYLKIEWWDVEDFVMDGGVIVYDNPKFKNVLYLKADIAKPEYVFEEEGETRDGYFFPVKQISEKKYRFGFIASEYLLDVMRFIRMADFAQITKNGQTWKLDTFLITPEWENNGDVANVTAEFETATVAKKIGSTYIAPIGAGDFNDDFNDDFNIL